ncbi:MAG: hypothetical protein BJ554DRAFT_2363 [Olpidium bornovanus]|uniref:TatD related DNase n=1 Tax=Olpidium bornovanus TaxID=278681 RepID=A0A8H8DGP4_9FUNG|nr:MAG: hypothetical protein BJ554DRAFT_2363 [Olpidium bornovanus]
MKPTTQYGEFANSRQHNCSLHNFTAQSQGLPLQKPGRRTPRLDGLDCDPGNVLSRRAARQAGPDRGADPRAGREKRQRRAGRGRRLVPRLLELLELLLLVAVVVALVLVLVLLVRVSGRTVLLILERVKRMAAGRNGRGDSLGVSATDGTESEKTKRPDGPMHKEEDAAAAPEAPPAGPDGAEEAAERAVARRRAVPEGAKGSRALSNRPPRKQQAPPGRRRQEVEEEAKEEAESQLHRPPTPLVDIGANLAHPSFRDRLAELLQRASDAGVGHIIVTGTSVESSLEGLELCRSVNAAEAGSSRPHRVRLSCTVGVHPHDAGESLKKAGGAERLSKDLEDIIVANRDVVVAVGETGLDYEASFALLVYRGFAARSTGCARTGPGGKDRNFSSRADQESVLDAQLELAARLDMPLFLHERAAHEELRGLLAERALRLRRKGVVHCFTSPAPEHARAFVELGFSIGITGWVCDLRPGRGAGLGGVLPHVPLDRIMIETDAPYLIPRNVPRPVSRRFRQNEPALLGYVLKKVAESYAAARPGLSLEEVMDEVAAASTRNACALFGLRM